MSVAQNTETDLTLAAGGKQPPAKLTGPEWVLLCAAVAPPTILGLVAVLSNFLVIPLLEEFHTSRAAVMFYLSLGMIGGNLSGPIVGRILTMLPTGTVMLAGVMVASAGLLLASFAPSLILVSAAFVAAMAIGCTLCGPLTCQTIVARRFPNLLGRAVAAQAMFGALLAIAMPLVVAPFLTAYGWRPTLAITAVIFIVATPPIILLFLRKEGPASVVVGHAPTLGAAQTGDAQVAPPTTREIMTSPTFWILLIALEPIAMVLGSVIPNLIPLYHDRGVGLDQAKYVFAMVGASALVGALVAGFIVDRIGPLIYLAIIASVGCAAMSILSLDIIDPAIPLVILMMALSGMGSVFGVAVNRLFGPAGFAPVLGLFAPFMMGSAFAGAGAGWMRDQFGSYQIVFAILAVALLISLASALLLLASKRAQQK